jgi:hypothetical protein
MEYKRGKRHCTVDLLFDWFGISCMATGSFCFYLQNRLIQTSQTGDQWYSDTSPFSIPWQKILVINETKWYIIWSKLTVSFTKSIFDLPPNFVKGQKKSWLDFCPFCMNNEMKSRVL